MVISCNVVFRLYWFAQYDKNFLFNVNYCKFSIHSHSLPPHTLDVLFRNMQREKDGGQVEAVTTTIEYTLFYSKKKACLIAFTDSGLKQCCN